ncbi:MAG: 4-hydroxy-tetrahydrodipicolinate reductase [Planctomycetes bacterium]|nr:4-hydroxy-tetrahydrodipicolinate reductase [Planctomycetota bacterium]
MSITVCIAGAGGRMGQRLIQLAHEDPDLEPVYALEHDKHPWIGKDVGEQIGLGKLGLICARSICPNCAFDVVIDFTAPEPTVEHAEAAAEQGKALVLGTTGLDEKQKARILACSKKVPVIHVGNYSTGVNMLVKLAALAAQTLGMDYEIEVVEAHHDLKVDAPSGTALMLAEAVAQARGQDLKKDAVYGREGHTGKRTKHEIGIHALRMGDVVGEHTVYFAIGGERLELTHKASSRDTFARGALRAAKWLIQERKGPGMYTMAQVLGFE